MSSETPIPVILARNISKTFKPLWKPPVQALKDVGFEVQSGEIVGLIGPNGAGKTTLLRILLGFLKADRGEVRLFGEDSESLDVRRKVGYQADYQFRSSGITVETYLKLHLALLGRGEENGQIDVLLKHFRLSDDRKRWLKDLSKGMRQKVELALAFLGSPELVFFDEPTASLDPPSVFELRDFLAERKGSGITVFFSSHNLTEVEKVCNRVLFIGQGQLRAEYSMEEVQPGFLEEAFRRHVVETIKS